MNALEHRLDVAKEMMSGYGKEIVVANETSKYENFFKSPYLLLPSLTKTVRTQDEAGHKQPQNKSY